MKRLLALFIWMGLCAPVAAQEGAKPTGELSAEDMDKSNNPLASVNSFNLHDNYAPSLLGLPDATANNMFVRGVMVKGRQIIRATIPFNTTPIGPGEYVSGLGDINIFDSIVLTGPGASTQLALGPMLVMDTAQKDELGSGKWQLGAAIVAMHPLSGGNLLGALTTYQTDVGGDEDRADVSVLTLQPFLTFNIGGGYYARSAGAVWIFDLENDRYLIPVGVGIGRVFRASGAMVNVFIEPDFTVYAEGDAQPALQIFTGMNFQWASK